ncbi:MAG TPA: HlyD family secretion protein [Caulobacteraceae bacterium]|nr:HlyD family secretion protein [Caulobacteraceae bacterium]
MLRDFNELGQAASIDRSHPQLQADLEGGAGGGTSIRVERREQAELKRGPGAGVAPPVLSSQPAASEPSPAPSKPRSPRRLVLVLVALAAALAGGWYGYHWWTVGRFIVWTDDAYVSAKTATLAAKVPGYIATLDVEDNAAVKAGDVIATIDDGDYTLAVDTARDKVATQQATIDRLGRQIAAQQAAVDQAKAQLVSAKAGAVRADLELARQDALVVKEFASRQTQEQARANRDQANAGVQSAQAAIDAAVANVEVSKGQQEEARRTLQELQTALAKAERDLSFTQIRAPFDGVVGNRAIEVGDYVQTGTRLLSLVPLDAVYIDANFKETQLAGLKPGDHVSIAVDALPGATIDGTVESIAPASGSVLSLLPTDNATGNFTKIVQRLAVRIHVAPEVARQGVLRPGMSVVASVDTRTGGSAAAPVSVSALPRGN